MEVRVLSTAPNRDKGALKSLIRRETPYFAALVAREMRSTRCTNSVHIGRRTVVKPYLPKGAKTYRIHPRVPVEYQAALGAKQVTRSLGTGDLREAKRSVSAAMQKAILRMGRPAGPVKRCRAG